MKAAAYHEYGPPEVLQLVDLPDPVPGPGELRVRVKAAGVQPFDVKLRGGGVGTIDVRFPAVPGNEFAGVVDAVGEGVDGVAVGDEVLGFGSAGCAAELVVAPAANAVPKPAEMPWEVAGALSASGQTALMALQALQVGAGDTVLVHAAAGGVGSMAVQLARAWGATVIGTASPANHDFLRSLGATPVSYGAGMVDAVRAVAPDGVDAALDCIGGDALAQCVELCDHRDRIGTLVAYDEAKRLGAVGISGKATGARLAELVELWRRGALAVHVRAAYPLAEAAGAHRDVETGHGRGKVVILV
ncbi:MAG: NADP-dependent oxidoreductase [Micromonosporaceae bacterium]